MRYVIYHIKDEKIIDIEKVSINSFSYILKDNLLQ